MKSIVIAGLGLVVISCLARCKKNTIAPVSGTINGVPALTLYGNSNKPADYIFLSTVATNKEMSYDGVVFTYAYLTTSATEIYVINANRALVKGSLITSSTKTIFTIDTTYIPTFPSTQYSSN